MTPGLSIVDVTNPSAPETVAFLPGPENTATYQVDQSESIIVTSLEKIFPGFGGDPEAPNDEGAVTWSLEDPANPKRFSHFHTGGNGTHRTAYVGGRYAHLAANMKGFNGNIYVIPDIADPANPVEAGRWWG